MVVLRQQQVSLEFPAFSYHGRDRDIKRDTWTPEILGVLDFWIVPDSYPGFLITTPTLQGKNGMLTAILTIHR